MAGQTTLSIFACLYWIMFFVSDKGVYPTHIFQLSVALSLSALAIYLDLKVLK